MGGACPDNTRKQNVFGGQGMQYHKVELCGVNTAKLPVLKEKEKAALLRAVKNGDEERCV